MNDNAVRDAIYARLSGDATLTGLLADGAAGIQPGQARQGTQAPYVVYSKPAGAPRYTMGSGFTEQVWLVKCVTEGHSSVVGGSICARVETLLHDHALSVSGAATMALRLDQDMPEYPETSDGVTYRHQGRMFRLHIQ